MNHFNIIKLCFESLSVQCDEQYQNLNQGKCSFFSILASFDCKCDVNMRQVIHVNISDTKAIY